MAVVEKDNIVDKRNDMSNGDSVTNDVRGNGDGTSIVNKLKTLKHKEIIIAILVILISLVAYTFYVSSQENPDVDIGTGEATLTSELEEMLGYISGVGDVRLIIVYNGGNSLEIASLVDRTTTTVDDGGRVTTTVDEVSTPILDDQGKPLVIGETRADIEGILVVCEGGDDPKVRVEVMSAIAILLNVKYDSINVLDME